MQPENKKRAAPDDVGADAKKLKLIGGTVSEAHVRAVLEGMMATAAHPLSHAIRYDIEDFAPTQAALWHVARSADELLKAMDTPADVIVKTPPRRALRLCGACETWGCSEFHDWRSGCGGWTSDIDDLESADEEEVEVDSDGEELVIETTKDVDEASARVRETEINEFAKRATRTFYPGRSSNEHRE